MSSAVGTPALEAMPAESAPTVMRRQRRGGLLLTLLVAACVVSVAAVAVVTGRDFNKRPDWQYAAGLILAFSQLQLAVAWFILRRSRPLRHSVWLVVTLVVWRWLVANSGFEDDGRILRVDANECFGILLGLWLPLGVLPALALLPFGASLAKSGEANRGQHHAVQPFQYRLRTLLGWFLVASMVPLFGRFVEEWALWQFFEWPVPLMPLLLAGSGVPICTAVALGSGRWRTVAAGLCVSFGACMVADLCLDSDWPGFCTFVVAPFLALYLLMLLVLRAAGYRLVYRPWWRRSANG